MLDHLLLCLVKLCKKTFIFFKFFLVFVFLLFIFMAFKFIHWIHTLSHSLSLSFSLFSLETYILNFLRFLSKIKTLCVDNFFYVAFLTIIFFCRVICSLTIIIVSNIDILCVQEVVTLQKKYLTYLHQKIRFTPFFNYYDILGWILLVYRAK